MKPEPHETGKNLAEDLNTFETLPDKTRDLLLLGDDSEKATGKLRAEIDSKIKPRGDLGIQ